MNAPPSTPTLEKRSLRRSQELLARARHRIPSCTQTLSKGWTQFVQGVAPLYLQRGQGSHVWDVDGNEYIDYVAALGAVILGYADPDVDAAVTAQLQDGVSFSLPHPLEVELAETLHRIIPCAEMVRCGKNGSDATAAAVRAVRALTGREMIACCGYHGWQDWYIGTTSRSRGVPEVVRQLTVPFQYNDIGSLARIFDAYPRRIAGVILEPVGVIEPHGGFLQDVVELSHKHGALVIFDEVLTGFRVALGGAQAHYGVTPDLAAVGKAMANGFPISAIVGREEYMQIFDEVFFSSTFAGEVLALTASRATIRKLEAGNGIAHLWRQGRALGDGYNAIASELGLHQYTSCIGLPPRTVFTFTDSSGAEWLALRSLVQQELLKRGILCSTGFTICVSHSDEDVRRTLAACRGALEIAMGAIHGGRVEALLEGPAVQPVFRKP